MPHPIPFFLEVAGDIPGARLALYHEPAGGTARGLVVYVPPFAEEMNKSRRMAALQARALGEAGFAVLQIDLLGCGDSAGDHGDASWDQWLADVQHACGWLLRRHGADSPGGDTGLPLWLWGLRSGALLAAQAASLLEAPCNILFWQPVTSGKAQLQQFLRLKAAAALAAGDGKAAMESLRSDIALGRPIEVGGYALSPALCDGLSQAALLPPPTGAGRVEWMEVSPVESAVFSPAGTAKVGQWSAAGWSVRTRVVRGPAFWQTTEIEESPALLSATCLALLSSGTARLDRPLEMPA